jgi:glycosyltransferase involved in cell wall biosynthesis
MKVVHLAAGAGSMYCGACAHDALLTRGLRRLGHDAVVMPLYTPLKVDGDADFPVMAVHLGGINAFLQQTLGISRRTPRWLDRTWDNPALLRWVSRFAISTKPSQLGAMTVSVLKGTKGRQAKEFIRLADSLQYLNPDVISITNSLLSGVAPLLKQRLGKPIVCFLQGEDGFLSALGEPYTDEAVATIKMNAQSIDRFIAPCDDHAECMTELLGLPIGAISVVRMGIDVERFMPLASRESRKPTVGYLSSIMPSKGLDLLVQAMDGLDAHLLIAGKCLNKDYSDFALRGHSWTYLGELDGPGKVDFLRSLDLFCLPSRLRESRGVVALEAMAAGTPCLLPNSGVFTEMIQLTHGGDLFEQGSVESLRRVLNELVGDPDRLGALSSNALVGVQEHYSVERMARETEKVFESLG